MTVMIKLNTLLLIFLSYLSQISPQSVNKLPLVVERGKLAYLSQANIPIDLKLRSADLCQIEVDDVQPLSSTVGFLKPKKFPCFFHANSVWYQHEGSTLTTSDTIFLNIYFFRKQYSSVQNTTITVSIITPNKPSRVSVLSPLTVSSWKGISQSLSSKVITIHYNSLKEFCRIRHLNQGATLTKMIPSLATRFWPMTGVLITFNKTKIYEFNMECQQAILMGLRFMHRKSRSSHLDFLPVIVEITNLETENIIDLTYIHIPIHISSKPLTDFSQSMLPPPIVKAFRSVTVTNSGGTLSIMPNDCLEISNQDKERGPFIVQILSIQGSYYASFRNLRDPSKPIWSFLYSDLTSGLIAFQLQSFSESKEKIFRVDLVMMDSYFVKSNVIILKLIDVLESSAQPFQVFTTPFYTYTSSNRPLRVNNIQIVGDINLELVKFRIVNYNITSGYFYKYPSESLVNKRPASNSYFNINDMKKDLIMFKHHGGLRESFLVNLEVSIDRFRYIDFQLPVYIVRVYNMTKESLLDSYTEFLTPKNGLVKLNVWRFLNKNYYFHVHVRDHFDFAFDIINQPQYGNILKLYPGQNITKSSIRTVSVRFQDLLDGLIFYRNDIDNKRNPDVFEIKQEGHIGDKTTKIVLNIHHYVKMFLFPKMDPNIKFSLNENNQYKRLSYLNLNYINHFLKSEDIFYEIIQFPRYDDANETMDSGRLISLKSIQSDILVGDTAFKTKITNYHSAHITSVTSFTQKQILENDIVYIPPLDDVGPEDKKASFLYTVKDTDGNEIRNVRFSIVIKAVNNQPPVLKSYNIIVPRDEEVYFTFETFNIQDKDTLRKNIIVEFVTLPTYGILLEDSKKILKNGYKFKAYKMDRKLIKYKHNGHNVDKDSFNIRLFDGIQTSQIYNIIVNVTKRVIPVSNWNLYINNSVLVKENSTVILHHSIFQNVLKSFDFIQFPNPMFIIVALPTRGNVLNRNLAVSTFYYEEVKKGFIGYQHISREIGSKPKFDFTQVWILETGESFNLNFTIQPVNSQYPIFFSQMALQVNEGGAAIISYYSISFVDLDSNEDDIIIQIIIPPRWGYICYKGGISPIKQFSINDIKLGKILYNNSLSGNGSEQTNDVFTVRGSDGEFQSVPLEIQIFIHAVNDEPPNLILNNFNIAIGEKRVLNEHLFQVSDADVPRDNIQITVSKFPNFGKLSLKYKYGEMRTISKNSPPVTLQLLKFVDFVYVQDNGTTDMQNLKFPIKDQFEFRVTDGKFKVKKTAYVNITGFNRVAPMILLSLIQLNKEAEKVVTPNDLSAIDPDTLSEDIIFTLLKPPEKGGLFLRDKKLMRFQLFSQKDIENRFLTYKYLGPSVTYAKDYFLIHLFDGSFQSEPKQVFIFLAQPIQIPKMSITAHTIKVNIGRRFVLDKNLFEIKNPISDVVRSLVITIQGKLTCGAFYYYQNLDYPITKFTFDDIQERRISLFVSECAEVVKFIDVSMAMFSHKSFKQDLVMSVDLIPRINAVPILKVNATITALIGSNFLLTNDILLTVDEDTPSDKLIYKYLNHNQSTIKLFVNKIVSQTFSQHDVNSEKVEIHVADEITVQQSNITLLLSDGENEGYVFNTFFNISGLIILPVLFSNWKHDELILLKFSTPYIMKFVDGYSGFQWTYHNLLVSRPDAQITVAKDLVAGFFYNIQSKQSIASFSQMDINKGKIFYLLHKEKSSKISKEIIQFKIFYQTFRISSETLELQWSIIEFERTKYKLCPQRGLLSINVIRSGNISSESQALLGFVSMEAIINQDFRLMSQMLLIFSPGEEKKIVSIKILMTGSVVKENKFQITLNSPKQAIFGQKSLTTISIKTRKSCGNNDYFLAEKNRAFLPKSEVTGNLMLMPRDFGYTFGDMSSDHDEVPSSEELEMQYKYYLSKEKSIIKCTKGWSVYSKRCYRQFKKKMSWTKANDACIKLNSFLASVTSDSQLQWIIKLFSKPTSFWIGLYRIGNDSVKWRYSNNEPVIFKKWDSKFPKIEGNKLRNCVLVTKNRLWRNRPCQNIRRNFVCMKNPEILS